MLVPGPGPKFFWTWTGDMSSRVDGIYWFWAFFRSGSINNWPLGYNKFFLEKSNLFFKIFHSPFNGAIISLAVQPFPFFLLEAYYKGEYDNSVALEDKIERIEIESRLKDNFYVALAQKKQQEIRRRQWRAKSKKSFNDYKTSDAPKSKRKKKQEDFMVEYWEAAFGILSKIDRNV